MASGHLFDDDLAVLVDRAVVDHADDGHTQVTPDAEGDAEADAAQHGDDVAARQPEASAVAQGSLALLLRRGSAILRQLDHLTRLLLLLQPPARQAQAHARGLFRFRFRTVKKKCPHCDVRNRGGFAAFLLTEANILSCE